MKLMIVGSGYVGLVAGACLSELGHEIVCVDRDATKIEGLRAGVVPIFEPGLDELVLRNAAAGQLTFASDLAELNNGVEAVFIAVGTPPSSIDQSPVSKPRSRPSLVRRSVVSRSIGQPLLGRCSSVCNGTLAGQMAFGCCAPHKS